MPAGYKRCVKGVSKHRSKRSAHAICTAKNAGEVEKYRKLKKRAKGKKLGG